MVRMRAASVPIRFAWAALFALMLALRLLGSSGLMPELRHGSLTLVTCPDADLNAPMAMGAMHHRGTMEHHRDICPYAAVAALGATGNDWTPLLVMPLFAAVLLLGRALPLFIRQSERERPPLRGPPIPA